MYSEVEKRILRLVRVRLQRSELFVFLVRRQPLDSLFQRMFQNVSIPKGRCARKAIQLCKSHHMLFINPFWAVQTACIGPVKNKAAQKFRSLSLRSYCNMPKWWQPSKNQLCHILIICVIHRLYSSNLNTNTERVHYMCWLIQRNQTSEYFIFQL